MKELVFIDCGTENLRIYSSRKGVVIDAPSYVVIENNRITAFGEEAKSLSGKVGNSRERSLPAYVAQPVQKGSLFYDGLLASWIETILSQEGILTKLHKPIVFFSVSPYINSVEKRAFLNMAKSIRIPQVFLFPHVYAILAGFQIDFRDTKSRLVIDIGSGKIDVTILSSGRVLEGKTKKGHLEEKNSQLVNELKRKYEIDIGEKSQTLFEFFCSRPQAQDPIPLSGKSKVTGLPVTVSINKKEIDRFQNEYLEELIQLIKTVIQPLSPEIIADLFESKVLMSGGGTQNPKLIQKISEVFQLQIDTQDTPEKIPLQGFAVLEQLGFEVLKNHANKT